MKFLKTLTETVNGFTKVSASAFKDHDKKLSSKRIFKLGGGGYLIYEGIKFLEMAVKENNKMGLYAGIGCILTGAFIAIGLSEKIKNLTIGKPVDKNKTEA
tara:strand:+ start:156 stop:458 length:303 start_codon:yes stop_codon:yes gene_type:complete